MRGNEFYRSLRLAHSIGSSCATPKFHAGTIMECEVVLQELFDYEIGFG